LSRILSSQMLGRDLMKRQRAYTKDDFFRNKTVLRILFLVAFASTLCLFYIWSRVQIVQTGYELNILRSKQHLLEEENRRLKLEVATLKSPTRLSSIATGKLGMVATPINRVQALE